MNVDNLNLISRTGTADAILDSFRKRERISHETTLEPFKSYLIRNGVKIEKSDFYKFFKDLEDAGVGELEGPVGKPWERFVWHYSLRDVSEQILNPNRVIKIAPINKDATPVTPRRPRGRPIARSKPKVSSAVYLFKMDSGDYIPFKLSEVERLISEVNIVKAKLAH